MSEVYSYSTTAQEIILSAFELIRVSDLESAQVPTTTHYNRALKSLLYMITAWQADGLQLWARKSTTFTLTAGSTDYTVGPTSTVAINRPLKIYNAWRHDTVSGIDVPLRLLSEKDYDDYPNKLQTGTPIALYYNPGYESNSVNSGTNARGTIKIYQPADTTAASLYTIGIRYQRPFNDFDSTSDTLDFPQEWMEPIKYGLAVRLAPVYGIPMLEYDRLKAHAKEIKESVQGFDTEWQSVYIQPRKQ